MEDKVGGEKPQFTALAQEMGVPVDYLMYGYAMSGEFAGHVMPAFSTFEEFREGILNDYPKALSAKVLLLLFQSSTKTLKLDGTEYNEKDLEAFEAKVRTWVGENGGNVGSDKKGCYVATAVYGSYNCPSVWTLRRYRDFTLSQSIAGRAFIKLYYTVSPRLVTRFADTTWFNSIVRIPLDRLVARLNRRGYSDTPYYD